uniref:CCHC-type domain-containing protein n=1 Tax=Fagus sylvatica TaxID=28930 RepID=A0A2N9GRF0_FAGSY
MKRRKRDNASNSLNSLPPSWDHIVTSLTHSGKELAMTTLPVLLMLEEDRMKRRKRDNASSSLMMTQSSHTTQFKPKNKFKHKRFKKQWTRKPGQEYKPRDVCYRCGEKGHYKINCPLNKRPKNKGKEIAMTITEALVIESPPTSWWVDSAATRHIARNHELFVDLKEKQLREHRVYMGNNTYSDVLGEGRCKFSIGDSVIVLNNVLYVPSVRRNLISVPVLDEKGFEVTMKSGHVFISKGDISVFGVKVDALSTAAYILNRVKTKSKPLTPFEIWTGHQPDMTNLKVWGCKAHVFIPKPLRNKLTNKTWECKFIGYVENGSGYRSRSYFIAESEESDPHVSVFSNKDLENSGRKRTSPKPAMPSIDADDSGRKRQRRPSSMLKDYYLMESKAVAIEDDLANFAKAMESRIPVGCKWVLRKKYKANGSLDKYKARLVAKGFTQQPGVDFVDTYLPVAKFASVRIIMVVATRLDLELHQLDVKTAFLNRDLKEEIYMDQPDGFQIKGQEGKVCRLKKSLYGLKPVSTPVSKGTILNKSMCPTNKTELKEMKAVPYAQAVGSLMYAMTSTRPDICYAIGLVSRYQSNPSKAHWQAVKRIFKYLQMTKNMKLCFGLDELEIKGFTNADFAGDTDDRKSTSGYVFLFGGTAVSWLSKKQGCVAKYTMEAEYIACSTAVSNAV